MSDLGAGLDEHQVVGLGLLLALLCRDLALVIQIGLVTDQHDDDVVPSLASDVVYPLACVLEGFGVYKERLA